jgi:hypothetical protein
MPKSTPVRAHYPDAPGERDRELHAWGGIVSGRISDIAEALNTTPEAVAGAVERGAVNPMMDTAEGKGRRQNEDRPTDPELRSLAFTLEELGELRSVVETTG